MICITGGRVDGVECPGGGGGGGGMSQRDRGKGGWLTRVQESCMYKSRKKRPDGQGLPLHASLRIFMPANLQGRIPSTGRSISSSRSSSSTPPSRPSSALSRYSGASHSNSCHRAGAGAGAP